MVATRHPIAAEVGCYVLQRGGNAIDAAVAASFSASVVQPVANTIGGGGLLVMHDAETGRSGTIDYRYEAPAGARADMFELADAETRSASIFTAQVVRDQLNEAGYLSVAVPGSVAGLVRAHAAWGRLELGDVMAPAISLARDGFEMDWYGSLMAAGHLDLLTSHAITAGTFLREAGRPYRPPIMGAGDILRQPALAQTLVDISMSSGASFYSGRAADELASEMLRGGGVIVADDLGAYAPREASPVALSYRGLTVLGAATAGLYRTAIPVLARLELAGLPPAAPARLHLIIEVLRTCRRDHANWYTDEPSESKLSALVSPEHVAALVAGIDPSRRTELPDESVSRNPRGEQTMHLSVVDADRMTVSLTETVLGNWGSGVTTEGGVLLNNGMSGFVLAPGHPNAVAPRRRPLSNMTPLVVLGPEGSVAFSLGASGGPRIVGAVLQVLSNVVDCGLGLQAAIAAPRVEVVDDQVVVDARLGEEVAGALRRYGHDVVLREEGLSTFEFGNPCGVLVGSDGRLRGGASPWQTTSAVGY